MAQKPWKRKFTFVGGGSNKFWEVEVVDITLITRWGRIGTSGQAMTDTFSTRDAAITTAIMRIKQKTSKGYKEDLKAKAEYTAINPLNRESLPDGRAEEAIALFNKEKPNPKPKRQRKTKQTQSESRKSSNPSPTTEKNTDDKSVKPKRKVKI